MLSNTLDLNTSGFRNEGDSVFSKTEHSIIAAYLILAGMGIHLVTCFLDGRKEEVFGTSMQCRLAGKRDCTNRRRCE